MFDFLVGTVAGLSAYKNLRVLANCVDDPAKRWVSVVDRRGRFTITSEKAGDLFDTSDKFVQLVVRVMQGQNVAARQRVTIESANLTPHDLHLEILEGNGIWVGGTVSTHDGRPAPDLSVVVFLVSTAGESPIARSQTDQDGTWESRVANDARRFDLRVHVLDAQGETIVAGPLRCDVQGELEEPLTVPDTAIVRQSRFDQLRGLLSKTLNGHKVDTLGEQEIELVACRTGESPETIRQMRESARWQVAGASGAAAFAMSAGTALTPSAVLSLSREELSQTLDAAVSDGIVPEFQEPPERVVTALRHTAAQFAIDEPSGRKRRAWLRSIGAPTTLAREIVRLERLGDLNDQSSWDRLATSNPPDVIALARDGVEMSEMGLTHAPLVRLLTRRRREHDSDSLGRMLPRLGVDEIEALLREEVDGRAVGVPDDVREVGGDRRSFALGVMRRIGRRFPTAQALHDWSRSTNNPMIAEVAELNPDLDLRQPRFTRGATDDGLVLPDGVEAEPVMAELRVAQRLFAVSPVGRRVETMNTLRRANLRSAAAIVAAGPAMFVRAVGDELDIDTMRHTYRAATEKSAMAVALVTRHTAALESVVSTGPLKATTATLENLFGPMSFCACEHCRSVLSPAAYLAELLQFIRQIPAGAGNTTLFNVLVTQKHRSDVPNLRLDCANSDTPLPYIDLVNELLESQLASDATQTTHQTTWSEQELRAHPEHLRVATYVRLRDDAVFPMSLPFDLFFTEVRAYLNKVGVSWSDVLTALMPTSPAADSEIGAARLGLSPPQWLVVVGEHTSSLESMWGVAVLGELRSVARFLDRAAMSYDELLGLLATRLFRRGGLVLTTPQDIEISYERPCQIEGATFEGMPSPLTGLMDRAHRFIRLWRASGWSMREVDLAIFNVGAGRIDRNTVANLGRVLTLSRRFHTVPRIQMLAWWGDLETRRGPEDAPSHYDDLFGAPGSPEEISTTFELNPARTELSIPQRPLALHLPRLAAALQMPVASLERLLDTMGAAAPAQTNLAALSLLFRYVSLGRALGLTPAQVQRWSDVLGIDPFESAGNTLRFLSLQQSALDLGATLDGLSYALGFDEPTTVAPARTTLIVWLARAVIAMQGATAPDPGPDATILDALHIELASLLDESAVEQAMRPFGTTVVVEATEDEDPNAALITLLSPWADAELLNLAVASLGQGDLADAAAQLGSALAPAGRRARQRQAAVGVLATGAGVAAQTADLLVSLITIDDGNGDDITLLETLTSQPVLSLTADIEALADITLPFELRPKLPLVLSALIPVIRRWHRGVVLLGSLGLGTEASAWLVRSAQALDAIAPDRLAAPVAVSDNAVERTIAFASLAARHSGTSRTVANLFEAALDSPGLALADSLLVDMEPILGWDHERALAVSTQLELITDNILDGSAVRRIDEALAVLAAADFVPAQLNEWINDGPTQATANEIKSLVSARIAPERRGIELGAVRDRIREQQRDALVAAYLADNPGLEGPNALYADFLIDPDMNACRTASRIQQGIAAVQRLMHRVLNGLDAEVSLTDSFATKWTWM